MDQELLQLCLDLVAASSLSVTNKQAWHKRLKESGVDKEVFEHLENDIRKTNQQEQQKLDYQLQTVVDEIDSTMQKFNEDFNELSAHAKQIGKNSRLKDDQTKLDKIRARLGL